MKCQSCQADLPAGSTFCTNCGTPVPSNPYGSPASSSSPDQGVAPTMLASTPPPSDPYGAPAANPYAAPPPDPYGAPPPAANPYGTPPPATAYGAPPPVYDPNAGTFGTPPVYNPAQFVPAPKKKGPNGCVIALIIVAVLFVLGIGGFVTLGIIGVKSLANGIPTSSQVVAAAQANITDAQTASSVDTNTAQPTQATTTFSTSDTIYLTYTLGGNAGYVMEKTYDSSGNIVIESKTPHTIASGDTNGYIFFSGLSSGNYVSGLYWCEKSDCSDSALAQVLAYTVS